MTTRIFYFEGTDGGFERCLELEDSGSLIYWTSPNRYAALAGEKGTFERLTVAEAKERWPQFATEIDRAIQTLP